MDSDINNIREEVIRTIKIIAEEDLGRSRKSILDKNTWWWNKKV